MFGIRDSDDVVGFKVKLIEVRPRTGAAAEGSAKTNEGASSEIIDELAEEPGSVSNDESASINVGRWRDSSLVIENSFNISSENSVGNKLLLCF